ncbi:MAG: hypothetical protein HKO59_10710 [Phycisphaerales bacterium]|nr:hypothetical protein [Phycisphaerales bacterium]
MATRSTMAIEIGRGHLRALLVGRERDVLHVRRVLVADLPEALRAGAATPEQRGEWIGERLERAEFPRGRVCVAVAREHVGLKRLTLPTVDDDELPEMTRLALQRELSFDAEAAVVDYLVVGRTGDRTTVMAAAAPDELVGQLRQVMSAAGLTIDRMSLRALGSAALLAENGGAEPSALVVDATGDGIEFSVVEGSSIRFSRAAAWPADSDAVPAPDAPAARAQAIVTETRRTWMSYRIVEEASDVARAFVLGDPAITRLAVPAIGDVLGVETTGLDHHPAIVTGERRLDRLWPLAGLLLETGETIDFAHPRRPVDRAARPRRWALMAAGLLVVLLMAVWTIGNRQGAAARRALSRLEGEQTRLRPQVARYQREAFTLTHLESWESVQVPWLEHVLSVEQLSPAREACVLDGWVGTLDFRGVRYDRKDRTWSTPSELAIVVDGEARDRATADQFRAALVNTDLYETISTGSDAPGGRRLPFGFTYRLRAKTLAPPSPDPAEGVE